MISFLSPSGCPTSPVSSVRRRIVTTVATTRALCPPPQKKKTDFALCPHVVPGNDIVLSEHVRSIHTHVCGVFFDGDTSQTVPAVACFLATADIPRVALWDGGKACFLDTGWPCDRFFCF